MASVWNIYRRRSSILTIAAYYILYFSLNRHIDKALVTLPSKSNNFKHSKPSLFLYVIANVNPPQREGAPSKYILY